MLLTILYPITSLVQEIDIPNFLLSLAILIALLSVIIQVRLCSLDNEVEWIRKELMALEYLLEDLKRLEDKLEKVKSRARQFWDSEVKPEGIDLQLSESAKIWVDKAKRVAYDASLFLVNFDKQREVRRLTDYLPTELFRIKVIHDVVSKKKEVESAMRDLLSQKDTDAKDICQTMEHCRSKNRGLLRYAHAIREENMSKPAEDRKQLMSRGSIQEVMTTKKHLFSGMEEIRWSISLLHPLHAFLVDLSGLQLDTETEKTWMRQAGDLIEEAEKYVDDFWWLVSKFGFRVMYIPFAKSIFRGSMKRICSEFHRLLERRTKYNLKFIDRAAGKPIRPSTSTYHNRDDVKAITSAVHGIRCKEKSGSEEVEKNIKSLCDSLEQMRDDLQGREDTAGRNACLEQLKYIATEVHTNLESYLRKPDQLMHFVQTDGVITLVRRIIDASCIDRQESTNVFGLENDIRRLVLKLTTNGDIDSVVSIFGMEGIGKTALAEAIYYNDTVVSHFQIHVWVTADQQPDGKFRARVLEMGKERTDIPLSSLRDTLKEKHAFVVADNISTTKDWDKLKRQLSGMTQGIRILLTTRSKDVAFHADTTGNPHQLLLRTKEESWKLFEKVISEPKLDEAVENRARKVVGKCGGLPLPIVSLGYLMSANGMDHEPLEWASDRINRGQNEKPWLDVEKNIYGGLDETLMNCLSHLILFPEGVEIPARRLVNLWVAEGFIKKEDGKTPEQVAEEYLQKLRDCNIIQAVELDFYGKIKTCRMPNVLREVILKSSNKKGCRQCQSLRKQVQRRFVCNFDDRDAILGVDAMSRKRDPLSILFFDTREGNKPGERIGNILSMGITSGHFNEVKVLDLERVFKPKLPHIISKLIRLKYLGLRWTYLEEVPQMIGELHDLETLDVKHTCIRTLPFSIMRLKKLRNLYLNQRYRSRVEGKLRGNSLENLQMLWGVFIDETSPFLHGLHRLKNLRKLKLAFQLNEKQQGTLAELIVQLKQLHSLRLKSVDKMGKLQQLIIMNDMSNLEYLSSLQLFGKLQLQYPQKASQLPRKLAHLTLSASNISDESMSEWQKQLTNLESLCFYADSYTWESLICTKDCFPKLRVLRFWKLEKLKKWTIEDEAMPSLVELEIRKCRQLDFTDDWKNLKALQKIRLQGMSEEFMTKIEKNRTFWDGIEIDHDNEDSL